jgi:hypothetical protein
MLSLRMQMSLLTILQWKINKKNQNLTLEQSLPQLLLLLLY